MKSTVWLSYDLGVGGDYEGLYSWLDEKDAQECGSSVAVFKYEHENDLVEKLKADVNETVDINKRSRLYVIFREGGKIRGRFLEGRRKSPQWTGYGSNKENGPDED